MTNLLSRGSLSTQHKCLDDCLLRSWDRKEGRQSGGLLKQLGRGEREGGVDGGDKDQARTQASERPGT